MKRMAKDPGDGRARSEAQAWVVRLASGEMTAEEVLRFKAWRQADPAHDAAFAEERALWRELGRLRRPVRRAAAWRGVALAAAACVALAILTPELWLRLRADLRSGAAVTSTMLPDGSQVSLDAGSAIAIAFTEQERRIILLRGGAWFSVQQEAARPFRVAARGGVTEDIGTAFAVSIRDEDVRVAVSSGRVAVASPEAAPPLPVGEGEQVRYSPGQPAVRLGTMPADAVAAWRQGQIVLANADLETAVATIARYRSEPVFLTGGSAGTRPISAVFRTDRPDEALEAVAELAKLRVTRLPGGVLLLRPRDG